jgi:putative toxin-antitoxin system antitoxin component (TIGR02293 family)
MTAQGIADYYTAVLASAVTPGPAERRDRPMRHAFVSERGSVRLSPERAAEAIHSGLRASIVNDIAEVLPVDKATVLRAIGIDKATLGRRIAKRAELDPAQAEAALRTMELTTLATETFGTLEKAAVWLKKPHPLLGGASPLDYANNQYALARVKSILSAIRYGGVV